MRRTIALSGYYVVALGSLLIALGLAVPIWSVYHRTQVKAARMEIIGGPVRPAMIILPAMPNGSAVAIAESEVTQAHFHRVMRGMTLTVASPHKESWERCPVPFNANTFDMPVTCVTPIEAAAYANGLTLIENSASELAHGTTLTACYMVHSRSVEPIPDCSGFRLPTVDEWALAARSNTHALYAGTDNPKELCSYANLPGCPGVGGRLNEPMPAKHVPNAWHLYDMTGNARELMIARSEAVWKVGGGSWRESVRLDEIRTYQERSADLGFRVVREVTDSRRAK